MNNEFMAELNDVLKQWQDRYCPLASAEDDLAKFLYERPIPSVCSSRLKYVRFDMQNILFYFENAYVLHIAICWPEEAPAFVASIHGGRA